MNYSMFFLCKLLAREVREDRYARIPSKKGELEMQSLYKDGQSSKKAVCSNATENIEINENNYSNYRGNQSKIANSD